MSDERIIAIETSSRRGGVALGRGPQLVGATEFTADLRHGSDLLPTIDGLCRAAGWTPASVRQVHLSIGPGSFTGLRVAVAAARHLALALDVRLVAVPSLAVIADQARLADPAPQRVAVILDAKRKQIYAGAFERRDDGYEPLSPPVLADPAAWLSSLPRPFAVSGEGIAYHADAVDACGADLLPEPLRWPTAASVHRLGWRLASEGSFTPWNELTPLYLRRPEAEEIWEQRQTQR